MKPAALRCAGSPTQTQTFPGDDTVAHRPDRD